MRQVGSVAQRRVPFFVRDGEQRLAEGIPARERGPAKRCELGTEGVLCCRHCQGVITPFTMTLRPTKPPLLTSIALKIMSLSLSLFTLGHSVLRTHSPNEVGKIVKGADGVSFFFFLDGASAHGW